MSINVDDRSQSTQTDTFEKNQGSRTQPKSQLRLEPEFNEIISDMAVQLEVDEALLCLPSTSQNQRHIISIGIPQNDFDFDEQYSDLKILSNELFERSINLESFLLDEKLKEELNGDEEFIDFCKNTGVKSFVSIPLRIDGDCRAVLQFFYGRKIEFTQDRRNLIELFSRQLSLLLKQGETIESLLNSNQNLRKKAETDALTGLPNQQKIVEILENEYDRAVRQESSLTVIMGDLDHFKKINDSYGHLFGDRILRKVAGLFSQEIRSSDEVGRYGGEEFLFVLPNSSEKEGYQAAERIREKLRTNTFFESEKSLKITVSFGIYSCDRMGKVSVRKLIERADKVLYKAKNHGRDHTVVFNGKNSVD